MVFCSVGNISDEKILDLFKKYFAHIVTGESLKGITGTGNINLHL